jgi:hypothetical protein
MLTILVGGLAAATTALVGAGIAGAAPDVVGDTWIQLARRTVAANRFTQ